MDKIKPLLKKKNYKIKSLFPPEAEFNYQNFMVNLKYIRSGYGYNLVLCVPEKNVEVEFPRCSSDVAKKSLKIVQHEMLEFEKYLQLISSLPREIHEGVLRTTAKASSASISVLQFLNALYQEDHIWRDDVLWIVDKGNALLAIKPEEKRKAKVVATFLTQHVGEKTLENFVLKEVDIDNISGSWSFSEVPFTTFEATADTLKERGHKDVAEVIRCAASYISGDLRDKWFERLENGLSKGEFQELKKKSKKIHKRRKREQLYRTLYEKFEKRRYQFLPDENELLIYPRCRVVFGVDTWAQKIVSDKYQYHISSRINTGKWPPSVTFKPIDTFYRMEIAELKKSVKKAIEEIPQVPADKLRTYFVDWVLSKET